MYLQEKHKKLSIRSYAKFMTCIQVAQVFIEEVPCRNEVTSSVLSVFSLYRYADP